MERKKPTMNFYISSRPQDLSIHQAHAMAKAYNLTPDSGLPSYDNKPRGNPCLGSLLCGLPGGDQVWQPDAAMSAAGL